MLPDLTRGEAQRLQEAFAERERKAPSFPSFEQLFLITHQKLDRISVQLQELIVLGEEAVAALEEVGDDRRDGDSWR